MPEWAYSFGGRDSQTVLLRLKATDLADLSDEVDVFFILSLLTLASLVFPIEVKEAAGQDEVSAGVRRPAERENKTKKSQPAPKKIIINRVRNILSFNRMIHILRFNIAPRWSLSKCTHVHTFNMIFPLGQIRGHLAAEWD